MGDQDQKEISAEKYTEKRTDVRRRPANRYCIVEFALSKYDPFYQFDVWNVSTKGLCILVKEDSVILKSLKVGDVLDMKYYPEGIAGLSRILRTEIRHVTKNEKGRFEGHYFVGLSLVEGTIKNE